MIDKNKPQIALNKENGNEYQFVHKGDYKYEYEDRELDTALRVTDDGFAMVTIDGVEYPVEIATVHQNDYEVLINGVGYLFSVETPFSLARQKMLSTKASESTTIRLKAPMPGKILDVFVKTGDVVKAGDTLLILEAMKMQNAILASTKGRIKKVLIKAGDATSKSDLLIEMEKE